MDLTAKDEIDNVFTDCFIPAVAKTGFKLERVDTAPKAGLIDDKIKVDIRTARFVLADLTGNNNGVYWEAGFAEGLGKPVIYTCKKMIRTILTLTPTTAQQFFGIKTHWKKQGRS
jgi:nucleoside 2-deoxyribosyltransferase